MIIGRPYRHCVIGAVAPGPERPLATRAMIKFPSRARNSTHTILYALVQDVVTRHLIRNDTNSGCLGQIILLFEYTETFNCWSEK